MPDVPPVSSFKSDESRPLISAPAPATSLRRRCDKLATRATSLICWVARQSRSLNFVDLILPGPASQGISPSRPAAQPGFRIPARRTCCPLSVSRLSILAAECLHSVAHRATADPTKRECLVQSKNTASVNDEWLPPLFPPRTPVTTCPLAWAVFGLRERHHK